MKVCKILKGMRFLHRLLSKLIDKASPASGGGFRSFRGGCKNTHPKREAKPRKVVF